MSAENEFPETLVDAVKYFAVEQNAIDFLASMRWPEGKAICPDCGHKKTSYLANQKKWKCTKCHRQFSIKVGTIMEDSPIKLEKWMVGMWLIVSSKNGISSYELHRTLGITQKSAWFLGHRIRFALQNGSLEKMKGVVEADETWIGGRARNMHRDRVKALGIKPGAGSAMQPVQGLLERDVRKQHSRVKLHVIQTCGSRIMQKNVRDSVEPGSALMTDAHLSYRKLKGEYEHQFIDHAVSYAKGQVHTNGLENFWSLLKRTIKGTYVNVEPFHLFRYLDEQAFRFNERKDTDAERFTTMARTVAGRRLTYADLTGKLDKPE